MKTAGIVAEFNPFHYGHGALAQSVREAGADAVVAVMSGNYVQRGGFAIADKRLRAHCALLGGIDLVLELPLPYATASAQRFALGAVGILSAAGCVDMLAFGSEAGNIQVLSQLSDAIESPAVQAHLGELLPSGITFAKARQLAVGKVFGEVLAQELAHPNNALALEYIRAAKKLEWAPELFTIARQGTAHDASLPKDGYASASYLRGVAGEYSQLGRFMPQPCAKLLEEAAEKGMYPVDAAYLERAVLAKLRQLEKEELASLPDLSEGLENRLYSAIRSADSIEGLYSKVKSKRYTLARVRRLVLHAFLGITARDVDTPPPYIRVLGFNRKGSRLLAEMSRRAALPVDSKLLRLREKGGACARFASLEERATDLYTLAMPTPRPCGFELCASGIFLK